ncbi:ribonuclease H-like domain-containing protein [Zavarzinella formosa]|uniref:ribonuclease H-like domain-containing protein n=1 Tax=Zavarzinella formosa TaxID=360055 RepID=UPI0002EF1E79|nr:ribonuclease H-like domain-containing protein [Zavarzinella formosa]
MPGVDHVRTRLTAEPSTQTAFLVIDTESIPDGRLLQMVKYPEQNLTEAEAIEKARQDARDASYNGSDFIPYTFQLPVAVCVARVGTDFGLQAVACLDAPLYRTKEIVKKFWLGLSFYTKCKLVTFNGRSFDLPLLEMAAFRYGFPAKDYFYRGRNRFNGDLDLMDWMSNYGACRLNGGLDLLAKLLGKPGKMDVSGDQVFEMHKAGKFQDINDYCMFDTLDTYFVFLRTRVLTGDVSPEQEAELIARAKRTLANQTKDLPALKTYLENWTDFQPWPA